LTANEFAKWNKAIEPPKSPSIEERAEAIAKEKLERKNKAVLRNNTTESSEERNNKTKIVQADESAKYENV